MKRASTLTEADVPARKGTICMICLINDYEATIRRIAASVPQMRASVGPPQDDRTSGVSFVQIETMEFSTQALHPACAAIKGA